MCAVDKLWTLFSYLKFYFLCFVVEWVICVYIYWMGCPPLKYSAWEQYLSKWNAESRYSFKEGNLKYSERFGSSPVRKITDLANFGLPCTLFMPCYSSQRIFKLSSCKNCIKQSKMNLQSFSAVVTNVIEFFCLAL